MSIDFDTTDAMHPSAIVRGILRRQPDPDSFSWSKHWHRVALGVLVLSLFSWQVVTVAAIRAADRTVHGHVVKIYDGDTVTIETNAGDKLRVRLADLDAPELKQNHGPEARDALKDLLADDAGAVSVTYRTLDKYGRALGTITAGDVNANLAQVKNGHAWAWRERGKPTNNEAAALEAAAKLNKRGLWAADRPQAPWDYRAAKRRAQTPPGRR